MNKKVKELKEEIKRLDVEIDLIAEKGDRMTDIEADDMMELCYKRQDVFEEYDQARKIDNFKSIKKENLTEILYTRLTKGEEELVKLFAKASCRSKSSAARMLIREGLANHIDELFE